ncbi:hypothetical protein Hs30E_12950 [Lactococcus hodotermopsidis]|uniref:Uncharacterized protein n=1 Tax=Pseudolactococcus hodotermopsidis TaxID=2709157 RepID=A0A6A0BE35_9LACT|nr:hypothetical protein [Lactococcus hodotermopsidis]GFH42744.1 hypothetical protein Hs30E_12950 [Lactococcus hodotermopsidis]
MTNKQVALIRVGLSFGAIIFYLVATINLYLTHHEAVVSMIWGAVFIVPILPIIAWFLLGYVLCRLFYRALQNNYIEHFKE